MGETREPPSNEIRIIHPRQVAAALADTTHLLITAPPGADGDPLLASDGAAIAAASLLRWIGYFSTTGVYGDRGGALVDEATPPAPGSERSRRRLAVEAGWARFADRRAVDLFRLGGIYGPGRSPFDELRAGRARRLIRPGHVFGRIHRDDIARAALAAMRQQRGPGLRVLNLVDDEPAEPAAVTAEAARLLGIPSPPAIPFDQAWPDMSPMARSFWAEHRRVDNSATKRALDLAWLYPTYREGLQMIIRAEAQAYR